MIWVLSLEDRPRVQFPKLLLSDTRKMGRNVESSLLEPLKGEPQVPPTKVRAKGQVTIPRQIREQAHLEEGDPLEVEMVPEGILLRPRKVIDSTQAWFWTPTWQTGEAEASSDIDKGRTETSDSDEDFLTSLEN